MEPITKEQIGNIFQQIDKDSDGYITKQDLQATHYALALFENHPTPMNSFSMLPEGKMNLENFTMLVHAARYNLYNLVLSKFGMEKGLKQYIVASAPAGAPPNVKQNYFRFKAHGAQGKDLPHWVELELGVDKDQQLLKIKQATTALGKAPHQAFLMVKIKAKHDGAAVAEKLDGLANMLLQLATGMAAEYEQLLGGIKITSKYANGYVYLIVEVDNPLLDSFIQFIHNVFESVSPNLAFKGKFKLASNLSNVLTEQFNYAKSGGQIKIEVDVDQYTQKKIKDVIASMIMPGGYTPGSQLMALLFEEIKVQAQFENLGEAMSSALNVNTNQLPKPNAFTSQIKEIGIKEMASQFSDGGPDIITLLNDNCSAEGEISINLHDLFLKLSFDLKQIKDVFDLLG